MPVADPDAPPRCLKACRGGACLAYAAFSAAIEVAFSSQAMRNRCIQPRVGAGRITVFIIKGIRTLISVLPIGPTVLF